MYTTGSDFRACPSVPAMCYSVGGEGSKSSIERLRRRSSILGREGYSEIEKVQQINGTVDCTVSSAK